VSKRLPNREQAIQILKENYTLPQVINHCLAVTEFALKLTENLRHKELEIDAELVEVGSLLHDIGRSKTHTVDHAVVGGQIAESLGLPESVVNIIKRHVGAGITAAEAQEFGWPKGNYMPESIEEKIVCYADKRIERGKVVPIENEIRRLENDRKSDAAERVRKLHQEITILLGKEL
jgi:uncharacterized protein (TIGR00295 family)